MYLSFKPAAEKKVCVTHALFSLLEARKKGREKNQRKPQNAGLAKSSFRYFCKILYELFGQLQ